VVREYLLWMGPALAVAFIWFVVALWVGPAGAYRERLYRNASVVMVVLASAWFGPIAASVVSGWGG
jgi:hypothetical protein